MYYMSGYAKALKNAVFIGIFLYAAKKLLILQFWKILDNSIDITIDSTLNWIITRG